MGKSRMMGAGNASASLYKCSPNLPTGGGNKKQGITSRVGLDNWENREIQTQSNGKGRFKLHFMNQLGGVEPGHSMFGGRWNRADGLLKTMYEKQLREKIKEDRENAIIVPDSEYIDNEYIVGGPGEYGSDGIMRMLGESEDSDFYYWYVFDGDRGGHSHVGKDGISEIRFFEENNNIYAKEYEKQKRLVTLDEVNDVVHQVKIRKSLFPLGVKVRPEFSCYIYSNVFGIRWNWLFKSNIYITRLE
jgi:hypothetical protein